jgi:hypothetical protein
MRGISADSTCPIAQAAFAVADSPGMAADGQF